MKEMKLLEGQLEQNGIKFKSKIMTEMLRGALGKAITRSLAEKVKLTDKDPGHQISEPKVKKLTTQ